MTVYEIIQELVQYDADKEVEINVKTSDNYKTYVEVKEDVQDGEAGRRGVLSRLG